MVSYFFLGQELILAFDAIVLLLLVVALAILEWELILAFDVIMLFGTGARARLRRDFAAPAGVCASGSGARSRLGRDRAALAGCEAPRLCSQR